MATLAGGGTNIGVGLSIFLRDQFTRPARNIRSEMRMLDSESKEILRGQMREARNMAAMGTVIGVGMLRGMANWVDAGSKFKYEMEMVKAIATDVDNTLGSLEGQGRSLAKKTMFTSQEVASGMKYMAMAGMTSKEISQNISSAVNLAGATQSKLGGKMGTADIMTNLMRQFQVAPELSGMVADRLTKTVTSANVNLYDLADAFRYVGTTAHTLGMGMEEVMAGIGTLGDMGLQGSIAGTAFENALRYTVRALSDTKTKRQSDAMKKIGLHPDDLRTSTGELVTMNKALETIFRKTAHMVKLGKASVFQDVFGVRGNRAMAALAQNPDKYAELYGKILNSQGLSGNLMNTMMGTMEGQILKLKSAWDEFKITFTEAVAPLLMPLLKGITGIVTFMGQLAKTTPGKILLAFASAAVLAGTTALALVTIVTTLGLAFSEGMSVFQLFSRSTVAGWTFMTQAAARYKATVQGAMLGGAGPLMYTAKGTPYVKNAATGMNTFLSKSALASAGIRGSAGAAASSGKGLLARLGGKRLAGMFGGRVAGALGANALPGIGQIISVAMLGWMAVDLWRLAVEDNTKSVNDTNKSNEAMGYRLTDYVDSRVKYVESLALDADTSYRNYNVQTGLFDNMLKSLHKIDANTRDVSGAIMDSSKRRERHQQGVSFAKAYNDIHQYDSMWDQLALGY